MNLIKKKGITLLETIIAMFISSIVLFIAITIFTQVVRDKYLEDKSFSRELSTKNLCLFIEGQCFKKDVIKVEVLNSNSIDNRLKFTYKENLYESQYRYKEIYLSNNTLVVNTYTEGYLNNTNHIAYIDNNIEKFGLVCKGNLIYVNIKGIEGEEQFICIVNRGMLY